jgi:hypothetical protein
MNNAYDDEWGPVVFIQIGHNASVAHSLGEWRCMYPTTSHHAVHDLLRPSPRLSHCGNYLIQLYVPGVYGESQID